MNPFIAFIHSCLFISHIWINFNINFSMLPIFSHTFFQKKNITNARHWIFVIFVRLWISCHYFSAMNHDSWLIWQIGEDFWWTRKIKTTFSTRNIVYRCNIIILKVRTYLLQIIEFTHLNALRCSTFVIS